MRRKLHQNSLRKGIKQSRRSRTDSLIHLEEYIEKTPSSQAIKCKDFDRHLQIMMLDSHLKFSQEFEMLQSESPCLPCTAAEMYNNIQKNRWENLLPFDHSRVKLLPVCDEPGSDFINANYIPGFSSGREYIASQGPLQNTVQDFWRMILEQSVSLVVMLTQCLERDEQSYKKKCEQYWPNSERTQYYGDLIVTCVSESIFPSYIIRIFHVQLELFERQIKQMQFTDWPDFGCPESPEDLVDFVRSVRNNLPKEEHGPILVHCSAGVGRTGIYIAVDRLSQHLNATSGNPDKDIVDIYATVLELRNHRSYMVQTEDQYIYVHRCVKQLILEREAHLLKECEVNV